MSDVEIIAPSATARIPLLMPGEAPPSPAEIIAAQAAVIAQLDGRLNEQIIAAGTCANIALCLTAMLASTLGQAVEDCEVIVPRELIDKYQGGNLTLAEDADRNVIARVRERAPDHTWEGRSE